MSACNRCTLHRIREREEGHIEVIPTPDRMPGWAGAVEVRRPGTAGDDGFLAWFGEVGASCECSWPEDHL